MSGWVIEGWLATSTSAFSLTPIASIVPSAAVSRTPLGAAAAAVAFAPHRGLSGVGQFLRLGPLTTFAVFASIASLPSLGALLSFRGLALLAALPRLASLLSLAALAAAFPSLASLVSLGVLAVAPSGLGSAAPVTITPR